MNALRHHLRSPSERAAIEMQTTLNSVAAEVRVMSGSLDQLRVQANAPEEPVPPVAPVVANETRPAEVNILELPEPATPSTARLTAGVDPSGGAAQSPIIKDESGEPGINKQVGKVQASPAGHEASAPSPLREPAANDPHRIAPASNERFRPETRDTAEPRVPVSPQQERFITPPVPPMGVAPVRPSSSASSGSVVASPPTAALPSIPDLRPQLEAFVSTVVRNQELTLSVLQDAQRLFAAHAAELADLKQQQARQLTWMANSRRP